MKRAEEYDEMLFLLCGAGDHFFCVRTTELMYVFSFLSLLLTDFAERSQKGLEELVSQDNAKNTGCKTKTCICMSG